MNFDASKCRKTPYLHKFATVQNSGADVLERCLRCGKKNIIKVVKGQVDVVRYSRQHVREFLIPAHRLFAREFKRI